MLSSGCDIKASPWGSPDKGARHVSSWGVRMEFLRIAMRTTCHQGEGSLQLGVDNPPPNRKWHDLITYIIFGITFRYGKMLEYQVGTYQTCHSNCKKWIVQSWYLSNLSSNRKWHDLITHVIIGITFRYWKMLEY